MPSPTSRLHAALLRQRWLVFALVGGWTCLAAWLASGVKLEEDLFQALPQDETMERYRALLESSGNADRIAIGFTGDTLQLDSAFAAADRFEAAVTEAELPVTLSSGPDLGQVDRLIDGMLARLPAMADSIAVEQFAASDSAALNAIMAKALAQLSAPSGMLSEPLVLGDPAGLMGKKLGVLKSLGGMGGLTVVDGRFVARDNRTVFVLVTPDSAVQGTPNERALVNTLDSLSTVAKGTTQPSMFGAIAVSMRNAERIAKDSRSTTLISLVLALVLIVWYFRRASAPLLILLPPAFGAVNALAGITLIQGSVSAISLGAGAALLGIAMAYGFHFLTHLRHNGSVAKALEETAGPLVLGCFTTVLAFLGLRLLDSPLLKDLGLLSALMLGSTAVFVLIVLPLLVKDRAPLQQHEGPAKASSFTRLRKWAIVPVLVITAILLPWADEATFDDEPEHLGWMPPEMRRANDLLFGSERDTRTVFIVAEGTNEEEARIALERAGQALRAGSADIATNLFLPTDLQPSNATVKRRLDHWMARFGNARGLPLSKGLEDAAGRQGFTPEAFHGFTHWLNGMPNTAALWEPMAMPDGLPGSAPVVQDDGTVLVSGLLRCGPKELAEVNATLATLNQNTTSKVEALDRSIMGERMKTIARRDLGKTLLFTSVLVFITLLISYGRIELALITFLPMALGWVWILGICGLFGIPFNMVNILICTFIFGLGDDYCIFTSDGVLERYKTGKDHTRANRDAVILTGITTLLGTGALLFAEHPALRSIATLSVVGMLCILVIALTVQPWLYRTFITGRAAKGRYPFTAKGLFVSVFAFLYFLFGCILLVGLFPLLKIMPVARMTKRKFYGRIIMLFTRSLVYIMMNVKKDIRSFRAQVEARPSIVVANHAGFIDILVMLMVHPRMLMMTNRWVWNSPFFGAVVRFMGFLRSEDTTDENVKNAAQALKDGFSITVFPEGTRSVTGKLNRFHKGSFWLAEELQAPMVPVVLHGVGHAMQKGDWLLKDASMAMRTRPTIEWNDARYGKGHRERTKAISAEFKTAYNALRLERETPRYWREKLIRTFLFKGPVLEWYVRIKSRIDTDLHERIHALVPRDASVVDLGCGYGMLSYLLHWSSEDRRILSVDHDAAKVEVAQNGFSRGEALHFTQADLSTYAPPAADVFILKDVLHYMPKAEQAALLERCSASLPPGGMILVRDGFADDNNAHARTRTTELFSTRLFGFNKTKGSLHFLRRAELEAMAAASGLVCEWTGDSAVTSNELVILRPHSRS